MRRPVLLLQISIPQHNGECGRIFRLLLECFYLGWTDDGLAGILARGNKTANAFSGLAVDSRIIVNELERHSLLLDSNGQMIVEPFIQRVDCRESASESACRCLPEKLTMRHGDISSPPIG